MLQFKWRVWPGSYPDHSALQRTKAATSDCCTQSCVSTEQLCWFKVKTIKHLYIYIYDDITIPLMSLSVIQYSITLNR